MKIRFFSYVRVIGLFLVLLYHFYPKFLPGGFIGVDIFFVFSGYLITALAISEFERTGTFDLKKFAERRFFRIFPTVFFAMLVTLPLTLLGNSDLRYGLHEQVLAGLGFISNIYEAGTKISYDNNFAPHLFVHLWSLAIEVQFYVVWGLIFWAFSRYFKRGVKGYLFLTAALFFILSSVSMFVGAFVTKDFSALYYSSFLHVFPFFLGGLLAVLAGIGSSPLLRKLSKALTLRQVQLSAILSGLLLLGLAFLLHFDSIFTYALGFSLASFLTLALILSLRLLHELSSGEEPRAIAVVADIRYGVYIFHWAFLTIFKNILHVYTLDVLFTLILSFAFAGLMFYQIDPILRGRKKLPQLYGRIAAGLAAFLLLFSGIAFAGSTDSTTLNNNLWQGSAMQDSSILQLSEKQIATGKAAVDTMVIGDSVTMGARPEILKEVPNVYVDAEGDREINTLPSIIDSYKAGSPLPKNMVLALGTNCVDPDSDIATLKSLIKTYAGTHHLVLVAPANWEPGGPFNSDKVADWEEAQKGKDKNVSIADWRAVSRGQSYFNADGIHISDNPAAQIAWVGVVKQALAD